MSAVRTARPAGPGPELRPRRSGPVVVWATVGAAFLALQVWVYGSWLASGDLKAVSPGPTPIPGWMHVTIRLFEAGSVAAGVAFLWFFLVRPWRKAGHITLDGMFCLAYLTLFWMDPMMNLFNTWFTYNAGFIAVASWAPHIPWWFSPRGGNLPQAVLMFLPAYPYAQFGQAILAGLLMRRVERRWPAITRVRLVALTWGALIAGDFIIESVSMRLGLWAFPGAIRGLSVMAGTRFQFPVYEAVTLAAFHTAVAAVRYHRDDQGRTAVERGADLPAPGGGPVRDSGRRFLAIVGFCNVAYLAYNLTFGLFGLHGDAWPKDIQSRSYITDGFCGVGTDYACPSPDLPLPRRGSSHFDPSGRLVP
ncbi:MAG TPA: spirocyclase AveC family protein [Acidimicrobiia bacterium]|nr:spirocyclase AveC family protein [Acidimicrobiia bacterium]